METNAEIFLKNLLEFGVRLQIETELESSQFQALESMLATLASEFNEGKLTAKKAVINLMEATTFLPGVYNTQMLSWRHRLQEMVHCKGFLGSQNLNYLLKLSLESISEPASVNTATQTRLTNPNQDHLLAFVNPTFDLKWTLVEK